MINAGAIAAVSMIPGAGPDEAFRQTRDFYSACARRPWNSTSTSTISGESHRKPQQGDRHTC